jgi:hypothetical protein
MHNRCPFKEETCALRLQSGTPNAQVLSSGGETMTLDLEKLAAELKAIESWDVCYYSDKKRDSQAVMAFESRQKRHREIVELIRAENNKKT